MLSICEVSESKTSLAIAANAKINVDTNFWIKISSLSATLPSLIGDMMMGSWSDIFGKWRMSIMQNIRCGAFSKFTSASYNFYYINIHIYQVVDCPSFFRLLVDFLPPLFISGGLISYYLLSHYQIQKDVMARWEDWIGDSHQPAFSCDYDFWNFSLVLVPSLPVSLLCVASLLRWYSLDNFAGIVVIWGWKAKKGTFLMFSKQKIWKRVF